MFSHNFKFKIDSHVLFFNKMSLETHMLGLINSEHSNFTIRCIDGEYRVIKELFVARSQYFTLSKYSAKPEINVNLTVQQFHPVVQWVYIGKKYVCAIDGLKLHDFIEAAHECRLMMLFEMSEYFIDKIGQYVTRNNIIDMLSIAREYDFESLRHKCYAFMRIAPCHGTSQEELTHAISTTTRVSTTAADRMCNLINRLHTMTTLLEAGHEATTIDPQEFKREMLALCREIGRGRPKIL